VGEGGSEVRLDDALAELALLAEALLAEGVALSTALRYLRTLFKGDPSVLSELKVMHHAERVFGRRFVKNPRTPDLISEDGSIAVEVKSFEEGGADPARVVRLWLPTGKEGDAHRLRQLGALVLLGEKGTKVYVAIHVRGSDVIEFVSLDTLLQHLSPDLVERARRYALNKQMGRPPAMRIEEVRRYVLRYPELAKRNKRALWYVVTAEGHKISYARFVAKVNQVLRELGWR